MIPALILVAGHTLLLRLSELTGLAKLLLWLARREHGRVAAFLSGLISVCGGYSQGSQQKLHCQRCRQVGSIGASQGLDLSKQDG